METARELLGSFTELSNSGEALGWLIVLLMFLLTEKYPMV
jgi:hypothetical protein